MKLFAALITALFLSACVSTGAAPGSSSPTSEPMASGTVIGLNYSGESVIGIGVEDPLNRNNEAGGDGLKPYDAGGMVCCYSIPAKWHPGIMARVVFQVGNLNAKWESHTVEIPPYPDGIPGDVWPMRLPDGSAAVVVSTYMPDHPKWNGPIKGYPVPSKEYQKVLWEKEVERTKHSIENSKFLLNDPTWPPERLEATRSLLKQNEAKLKWLMEHKP
jgi:hypothetical protein